jgi:hypothetical protein
MTATRFVSGQRTSRPPVKRRRVLKKMTSVGIQARTKAIPRTSNSVIMASSLAVFWFRDKINLRPPAPDFLMQTHHFPLRSSPENDGGKDAWPVRVFGESPAELSPHTIGSTSNAA